jgi:hypothetical protein
MTAFGKLIKISKEAVMAYLKVQSWHSPAEEKKKTRKVYSLEYTNIHRCSSCHTLLDITSLNVYESSN